MCGRYTLTTIGQIPLRFGIVDAVLEPRYNIAPSQLAPVLIAGFDSPEVRMAHWGFRPEGPTRSGQPMPINARAETLAEHRFFRGALARHRCLVLADGFYEWQTLPGQRVKQPYHIGLRDSALFAFAGLYTPGGPQDSGSFAIITTAPNAVLAPIHNRMPAILRPGDEAAWIDPELQDPRTALALLHSYPAELMQEHPVATLVSTTRNEGPELIRPVQIAVMRKLESVDG